MEKNASGFPGAEHQSILDASLDAIFILESGGRILNANLAAAQCYGYSVEELRQLNAIELTVPELRCAAASRIEGMLAGGAMFESRHLRRDGSLLDVEIHAQPISFDGGQVIFASVRDICERKLAEAWLERRNQLLEMIVAGEELPLILETLVSAIESQFPGMLGSVLLLDEDGVHMRHGAARSLPADFNAAVHGLPIGPRAGSCGTAAFRGEAVYVEDLRTDPLWDDYRALAMPLGLVAAWSQPIMDGSGRVLGTFAMYYRHPALPGPRHLFLMESAVHMASIAISRHRERVALEEMDARLVTAQKVACLGFFEWNLKTNTMYCSDEAYRLWGLQCNAGFASPDIIGKVVHPDDLEMVQEALQKVILGLDEYDITHRIVHSDGRVIWVQAQAELSRDPHSDADVLLGTMLDNTRRITAEVALERMTRLYAALSQCNQAIVRCESEEVLFPTICRVAVEFGGMRMAWIGKLDESTRMIQRVASFGVGEAYSHSLEIPLHGDGPESRGPTATSIREKRPYWCQDFMHDPCTEPWRERAASMGWNASASLPLYQRGVVVGALAVYSEWCNAFDKVAQDLLLEMAADISFALDRYASEADRKLSNERLRESELRLRTIIETEPECVKVIGQGGELLDMNAAGLVMLEVDSIEQARERSLPSSCCPSIDSHSWSCIGA